MRGKDFYCTNSIAWRDRDKLLGKQSPSRKSLCLNRALHL